MAGRCRQGLPGGGIGHSVLQGQTPLRGGAPTRMGAGLTGRPPTDSPDLATPRRNPSAFPSWEWHVHPAQPQAPRLCCDLPLTCTALRPRRARISPGILGTLNEAQLGARCAPPPGNGRTTIESRRRVLSELATSRVVCSGFHLSTSTRVGFINDCRDSLLDKHYSSARVCGLLPSDEILHGEGQHDRER